MDFIIEPEKKTQIAGDFDLCVLGGSCTGVFAAVRAARMGARVALVEDNGFFGGVATAGLVTIWHSAFDTTNTRQIVAGLSLEIIERLEKHNAVEIINPPSTHRAYVFNPEELKIELDELITQSGVTPFLHTKFVESVTEDGKITAAIIEDKSGRRAIKASYFIDATGDGDLLHRAGFASTKYAELQPPTTVAIFDNYGDITRQTPDFDLGNAVFNPEYSNKLKRGFLWGSNVIGRPESQMIAGTRTNGADCSIAEDFTRAEIENRRQIRVIGDILRKHAPGGEKLSLANIAHCTGVRETRHFHCRHMITELEVLNGKCFDDAIGYGTYPCDTHHSNKPGITLRYLDGTQRYCVPGCKAEQSRWKSEDESCATYYQIPFASLIPLGARNVLAAGRMVGMDKGAYGAIRVMMNCNQMGEAAGVASVLALQEGIDSSEVDPNDLRNALKKDGSAIQ